MEKRRIIFGDYDTARDGLWTLCSWTLSVPEFQSNLVTVPGRHGPLDLSTALTNGEPCYESRTLTARLESSEGNRLARADRIHEMVNHLDGRRMDIILPDDPTRYITGRVQVRPEYNDMVHAAVVVTAECDPWRYNKIKTRRMLHATETEQLVALSNTGRRVLIPDITVTGEGARVQLTVGSYTWELEEGGYYLPELELRHGNTALQYSGSGVVEISYREAVL